jgi:hypothetical protein
VTSNALIVPLPGETGRSAEADDGCAAVGSCRPDVLATIEEQSRPSSLTREVEPPGA